MTMNMGGLDRILRVIVGLALIAAAATGYFGAWAYVGFVPLVTALIGSCPMYTLVGMNTCPAKKTTA
jgi:hypothetical protein